MDVRPAKQQRTDPSPAKRNPVIFASAGFSAMCGAAAWAKPECRALPPLGSECPPALAPLRLLRARLAAQCSSALLPGCPPRPVASQPRPQLLERAASKVVPFTHCLCPSIPGAAPEEVIGRNCRFLQSPEFHEAAIPPPTGEHGEAVGHMAAAQHGRNCCCPPSAVPQLGPCTSSGRAWRLWAARHSQGRGQATGRPATGPGARASRITLQSRRCSCLWPSRRRSTLARSRSLTCATSAR